MEVQSVVLDPLEAQSLKNPVILIGWFAKAEASGEADRWAESSRFSRRSIARRRGPDLARIRFSSPPQPLIRTGNKSVFTDLAENAKTDQAMTGCSGYQATRGVGIETGWTAGNAASLGLRAG